MARLTKEQKEALREETILGTDIDNINTEAVKGGESDGQVVPKTMEEIFQAIYERLNILEKLMEKKPQAPSINKLEAHSGDTVTTIEDYKGISMGYDDKIQSMRNAIAILPPNMIREGRHSVENIQAICGFQVTEDMLDSAYEGLK
jgi:hypothetical protein